MIWLLAGVFVAAAAIFSLVVGIFVGCIFHWHASLFYARNADDAIARAKDRAYADHLAKLEAEAKRLKELQNTDLPDDRDEKEASFEQSLATVFPNDPKIQEALKKQRRDREATSG